MAPVLEFRAIADRGNDCRRGFGPNALDLCNALAGLALKEDGVDLLVENGNAPVQIAKEIMELVDCFPCQRCQFVIQISENLWDQSSRSRNGFRHGKAAIQEKASDLADNSRAVIDHALTSAV